MAFLRLITINTTWLFKPFEHAIGHFRRCHPDCVGLAEFIANRWMLRQFMPTRAQLRVWDSRMVPLLQLAYKLIFYSSGKSIISVWPKP